MTDEPLLVTANLAQACEVEVTVGMRRVNFYAPLVRGHGRVISLQFFKDNCSVKVKQRVIGEVFECVIENGQRVITARFNLTQQYAEIGVRVVVR